MRSIFLFSLSVLTVNGILFKCLDRCECDTSDRTIHCHNGDRDRFQLPSEPLAGFRIIGLTRNNLKFLPSEDALKESFPDLIAVDVEANPHFDCETLGQYSRIQILSNCGKDEAELDAIIVDDVQSPSSDCDIQCQLDYHYKKLHAYVQKVLKLLKEKFEEAQEHPVVKDVKDWVSNAYNVVKEKISKIEWRSPIVIREGHSEEVATE